MRLDDPADPTRWHDLQERIGQIDSEIVAVRQHEKQRVKTLKRGQYHAKLLREGSRRPDDWKKVIEVVETLVGEGVPPSNTDLRDMLVPIVDELPEAGELPAGFQRVLAEVDRYLATQAPPPAEIGREVSAEVLRVADLYAGKTLILIGGDRRPFAYEALKAAFRLKELIWITTREHESTEIFVPYVARSDVDAVLLAIRWTSHSYGDVRGLCEKYGKEFFRLPAGYNPSQVTTRSSSSEGTSRGDSGYFDDFWRSGKVSNIMKRKKNRQQQPKISESILAFAGDFILFGKTLEDRHARLTAACSAWNMACNTPELRKKHLDQYVRGYGKFTPDADAEHLANVRKDMETLIETKLKVFPNDLRQVIGARIISEGGKERIEAAAMRVQ